MRSPSICTRHALSLLVAGLLAACVAPALHAQHSQARQGFYVGTGLGYGTLGITGISGRHDGVMGYVKLGGVVTPNLLLGFEGNGWSTTGDGVSLESGAFAATVTYYPLSNCGFFVSGGPGIAGVEADEAGFGSETEIGFALLGGGGYDVRIGDRVSITPSLRYVWGNFSDGETNNVEVAIGITIH